jgi:CBS domain containing-hemolysin-like protein
MMTGLLLLLAALVALVLGAFFSGTETGVYCVNRVRLHVDAEQGHPAARRLERLLRRPEDVVITALLGTSVVDYVATAALTALLLTTVSEHVAEVYATAIAAPLIFVFAGIVPKEWFRRRSNVLMARLSWFVLACLRLAQVTGVVWLLRGLSHALIRRIDPQHDIAAGDWLSPRARTLHLVREGVARGGLTHLQRDLIERVLNLSDVRAGNVMIPRPRVAAAPLHLSRDEFLRIARMAHFSRLPVYRDDPRQIIGIVNVYDVLTDRDRQPVAAHVRPPLVISPQVSVAAALPRLQRARQAMAIVEDGAGHCLGILTVKDLVEEIVGDLEVW